MESCARHNSRSCDVVLLRYVLISLSLEKLLSAEAIVTGMVIVTRRTMLRLGYTSSRLFCVVIYLVGQHIPI